MKGLLENVLNNDGEPLFPHLACNSLASLTFAASWKKDDCIVTLNYNAPLEKEDFWLEEARQVCRLLNLAQLQGRSRKRLLSAISTESVCLRDTIYLVPKDEAWHVSLQQQDAAISIPVHYHKPEGAFFHPNARVMCQALSWMLNRISTMSTTKSCRLLELYCGCGAHTLALAKSQLLASIRAVELDSRLVEACKVNIDLNQSEDSSSIMSPIQVVREDAGQWARKTKKRAKEFDILLVDPPRQGLDAQVIDLAIQGGFQHVLIISCGHQALMRDLKLLCAPFEIMDCQQLDLFPRTDSVETLVHLRRREE